MDQIFTEISALLEGRQAAEQETSPSPQQADALDALVQALDSAGGQPVFAPQDAAGLVHGLKTVQEIAVKSPTAAVPHGRWVGSAFPLPTAGKLLTLKRAAPPEAEMGFQCERSGKLYGQFYLSQPGAGGEATVYFYLVSSETGWVLHGNHGQPFQAALTVAADALPWNGAYRMAYQDQLEAAMGASSVIQETPPPDATQTVPPPVLDLSMQATVIHPMKIVLVLVLETSGRRLPLLGPLTIGRDKENDLCLEDKEASRKHAIIEPAAGKPAAGGWQLRDLQSSNGTWLNGKRLDAPALLAKGDVLVCGKTQMRLESRE